MSETKEKYDVYKDSPLRFAGYANELGEAFRPLIPKTLVYVTYGIAFGYGMADAYDKGTSTHQAALALNKPKEIAFKYGLNESLYTGIWQLLASVIIPPFFVNRTVSFTNNFLATKNVSATSKRWLPVIAGLAVIPIIFKPIDHSVDFFLEHCYRGVIDQLILPTEN